MKLPIELIPIEGSSNLSAYGYDGAAQHLYVRFHNGDCWRYLDVPAGAFNLMRASESKGSFFAKCIKPNHVGEKVEIDGVTA